MKKGLKIFLIVMSFVLVIAGTVGATLAYLTAKTTPVTNTFTAGKIEITLTETTSEYKLIPGATIAKDPTITVKAGSEASWLFVKVDIHDDLVDVINFTMADGWTALAGEDGVYYRSVDAVTSDTVYQVLKDNVVNVNINATVDDINNADTDTLEFTAYACQSLAVASAADAWAVLNPQP